MASRPGKRPCQFGWIVMDLPVSHQTHTVPDGLLRSLTFDTDGLSPDAAFAKWAELMVGYDVGRSDSSLSFSARAQAWRVGPLVISRSRLGAVRVTRTREQIARDDWQHYSLVLPIEGAWDVISDGRQTRSDPGVVTIFDNDRPYTTTTTSLDAIVVMVDRHTIDSALGDVDLHCYRLNHPAGRLLADYLALLTTYLPTLPEAEAPFVAWSTLSMIVSSIRSSVCCPMRVRKTTLARHARRIIDSKLGAGLTPDRIQAEINVSRATLYRLFAPFGGVSSFIRERRLTRIHALVAAGEPFMVKAMASRFGFASGTQLSRSFSARFGYSLSQLSARSVPAQAGFRGSGVRDEFRHWIDRLYD